MGWLWALLGLLVMGLLAWWLISSLSGDDDGSTTGATEDISVGTGGTTTDDDTAIDDGSATGGSGDAFLTIEGQPLLNDTGLADNFTTASGSDVDATSVPVESVVADEGFWVGTGEQDRVFVHLGTSGESPFKVRAGETVSFENGTLQPLDGAGSNLGVEADEGADLLKQQGRYVLIEADSLQQG